MTLTTRLAIAMSLLVAIAVSAVGWLSYRNLEQVLLPRVLDRIEAHSRLIAFDLQSYVAGARGDIASFRSATALVGLDSCAFGRGHRSRRRPFRKDMARADRRASAHRTRGQAQIRQFRIIGIEDGGREIVRADRSGPGGPSAGSRPGTAAQGRPALFQGDDGLPAKKSTFRH